MYIEYLLVKKSSNELVCTKELFNNYLMSNSSIIIKDDEISYDNTVYKYVIVTSYVENEKENVIFNIIISLVGENKKNAQKLEQLDSVIKKTLKRLGDLFIVNTIWNGFSIYYGKKLYPDIVDIENKLRKIIYKFMIKTLGREWFSGTVPTRIQNNINNNAKNNKEKIKESDQLYYANFNDLSKFMSEEYSIYQFNDDSLDEIKNISNKTSIDEIKSSLENLIAKYQKKSNWERYFSEIIDKESIESFAKLYNYRNPVAHSRIILFEEYVAAKKIIDELEESFDKCLDMIGNIEVSEIEAAAVKTMADIYLPFLDEKTIELLNGISSKLNETSSFENASHYSGQFVNAFYDSARSILGGVSRTVAGILEDSWIKSLDWDFISNTGYYPRLSQDNVSDEDNNDG